MDTDELRAFLAAIVILHGFSALYLAVLAGVHVWKVCRRVRTPAEVRRVFEQGALVQSERRQAGGVE